MKPNILVPFDFSATAERALAWAAELQRATGAPPLHLLHAITSRPVATGDVLLQELLPNTTEIAELERAMVERARSLEAEAAASVWIRASNVGDIILDAAKHFGAGLIVMGSHGRTGVKRLVLGSVAEHVLRHATCPVVTVRAAHPNEA
jgi:nucleotide-binding universal stress UspA family protein